MKARFRSPFRIAAFERRCAAIHEAGHVVAARWRGVDAYARIWPTGTNDPDSKAWVGQAHLLSKTNAATRRLIGVAGAVAEYCWRDGHGGEPSSDCLEPWFWEDVDVMSATDWAIARTEPGEPDHHFIRAVERVHAEFNPIDGKLWPKVRRVARQLIVEGRPLSRQLDIIRATAA